MDKSYEGDEVDNSKVTDNKCNSKKILIETIVVISITIILAKKFTKYESMIIVVIPLVYFFTERIIRHRSWSEVGFTAKDTLSNLCKNWKLCFVAGIIMPLLTFFIAKYFCPEFIIHVKSRLPIDVNVNMLASAIISIVIGTFLEEIIFRGFIQARLSFFINLPMAIIFTSLLFSLMHISKGSFSIVAFDLGGIFIDSILYGIIFSNTNNIFTAWISHFASDLTALLCVIFLFK